jgi:hypothetical protein
VKKAVRLQEAEGPCRLLKEIPVGTEGGWDCALVDSGASRLYVSHGTSW